jgi:hypothetical protein
MKRLLGAVIAALFLGNSVFAQGGIRYLMIPKESLRNAPNGSLVGEMQAGARMEILERKLNWVRIQMSGWIPESSLTADSTMVSGFTMRASHILVRNEADANAVLGEIRSGVKFEDLVKKYSIDAPSAAKGGDIGEFRRGDLMPEFESAVLKLKIGETSGAVRSALGYHVIKRTK